MENSARLAIEMAVTAIPPHSILLERRARAVWRLR